MPALPTFPQELLSPSFWQSPDIHIASPPNTPTPPAHLLDTVRPHLLEGGCLFLTSGTTGSPKWVALEKRALLHSARVVNAHYDLTRSDHWLLALPLHHVGGFSILARAYLSQSQVTYSQPKWNPRDFIISLQHSNASTTSIVPTQLYDLVTTRAQPPSTLRLVLVGGGLIEPTLFRNALSLGWPVCATYGMTEACSQIASQPLEHDRFNDPETLEVLPHWHTQTQADDTLTIQGPSLAKGYCIVTETQSAWEPIDPAIGLHTTDRVHLRSDGTRSFLQFRSRSENVVKVLGELVSLDSLEQHLTPLLPPQHPPFAIIALPDPRRENRLVLVVESPDPLPSPAIASTVARYNATRPPLEHIDTLRTLPRFPRSDLGKLSRTRLADALR